ncbi:MAG: LysE family translocator [Nitriliruptoraceae bacterium]|nr:LysE family translocator [Nitriliruptoraceae bacterium]
MELATVTSFAAIAATLIAVPGPDWAYVLASGARDRVVVPAVAGITAGYALITAIVVVGMGPIVAATPIALTTITAIGAAYLIHLGIRITRTSADIAPSATDEPPGGGAGTYFGRGLLVSGLNPKGLLILLAVLPQFIRPDTTWPVPAQLAALGGVFTLLVALFYLPLGFAADRVIGARPRVAQITTTLAGLAMIVLGAGLLIERGIGLLA